MLFYFILGALFIGIQVFIRTQLQKAGKAKLWPNCILSLTANALILFSAAWGYASFVEHETQAAVMGFIIFGGSGVIVAILAYRAINKPVTEKVTEQAIEKA